MKVIQTIQSTDPFGTGAVEPPAEVVYYTGDSLAQAMSAMVDAAASSEDNSGKFYRVLSVNLHIQDVEN